MDGRTCYLIGLIFAWVQGALYAFCTLFLLALCGVLLPDPQISGLVIFCAAIGRGAGYSCQATLCERRIKRAIDTDADAARVTVLLKPPRPKPTDDD